MKKIAIALLYLLSAFKSNAQDSRIYLGNGIYGSHERPKNNFDFDKNGENFIDNLRQLQSSEPVKKTTACGCNLQDVCNASPIYSDLAGNYIELNPAGFYSYNSTPVLNAFIGNFFGTNEMILRSASSGFNLLQSASTSTSFNSLPDESGTLVTHTTKDPVTVYASGTNDSFYVNGSFWQFYSGGHSYVEAGIDRSGSPVMGYIGVKSGNNDYHAYIESVNLSAERIVKMPDQSGTFLLDKGASTSQVITAATTVTVTHGLGFTPSRVFIQATNALMAGKAPYVSAKTSTTFTITLNAATTGTVAFDWQVGNY